MPKGNGWAQGAGGLLELLVRSIGCSETPVLAVQCWYFWHTVGVQAEQVFQAS